MSTARRAVVSGSRCPAELELETRQRVEIGRQERVAGRQDRLHVGRRGPRRLDRFLDAPCRAEIDRQVRHPQGGIGRDRLKPLRLGHGAARQLDRAVVIAELELGIGIVRIGGGHFIMRPARILGGTPLQHLRTDDPRLVVPAERHQDDELTVHQIRDPRRISRAAQLQPRDQVSRARERALDIALEIVGGDQLALGGGDFRMAGGIERRGIGDHHIPCLAICRGIGALVERVRRLLHRIEPGDLVGCHGLRGERRGGHHAASAARATPPGAKRISIPPPSSAA